MAEHSRLIKEKPDVARSRLNLRLIDDSEFSAGVKLRGDIRDSGGRILARAGQVLTEQQERLLKRRNCEGLYGGPDWDNTQPSPPATPEEVIKSAFERHGEAGPAADERSHVRHQWAAPLKLLIEEVTPMGVVFREIETKATDISRGGFGFTYQQYLSVGTRVRAEFDTLPSHPRLEGVVRNCRLIQGRTHRIGVQFIGRESE